MKITIQFILSLVLVCAAKAQTKMLVRLQADGNGMQNEAVVYFDSSATYSYNAFLDAPSLGVNPGYLNIVTHFDSIDFQVKALPILNQGIVIPLKITTGTSGQYLVRAQDLQNLPSGACAMLHDAFSGVTHDLRAGDYSCMISDTESVARFSVNIILSVLPAPSASLQNPTCSASANGKIVAQVGGLGSWNYYWKDSANNIIRVMLNKGGSDTLKGIGAGFYRLDVNAAGTCSNGTKEFVLEGTLSPIASFAAVSVAAIFSNVHFTNSSLNASGYLWDFGDGMGGMNANAAHSYSATNIYTVSLSAFSNICNETSTCTRVLTVVGTTGLQDEETLPALVSRDANGHYVALNNNQKSNVIIWVADIAGTCVLTLKPELGTHSRLYLDIDQYRGQVLLVNVLADTGMISKKIIVE